MKIIKIIILIALPLISVAGKPERKKNSTEFEVGLEYRMTPIYLSSYDPYLFDMNNYIYCSVDRQLSGTGLNYSFQYSFSKPKMRLGFGQTLRYNYIYTDLGLTTGIPNHVNKIVKGLIMDYHFSIEKYWTIRQNEVSIHAGYSFMNRGTNYSFTKMLGYWPDSTLILYSVDQDFNFSSFNFELGYKFNNLKCSFGCYFTDTHNFLDPSSLCIINFKINYILRLNKKKTTDIQ